MTNRLRRLDRLFAERVLGKDLNKPCLGDINDGDNPTCDTCGWSGRWENKLEHLWTPPHYTTSLDAAWEGLEKLGAYDIGFDGVPEGWHCCFSTQKHWDTGWLYARAGHPAEALVLACLRACGTGEEELT